MKVDDENSDEISDGIRIGLNIQKYNTTHHFYCLKDCYDGVPIHGLNVFNGLLQGYSTD